MPALIRKKSGSKVLWYVVENKYIDGKNRRETIESLGDVTKSEAKFALARHMMKKKSLSNGDIRFRDIVDEFRIQYRARPRTLQTWEWHIRYWIDQIGHIRVRDIAFDDIERFKRDRMMPTKKSPEGWGNRSINISMIELTKVLKYALEMGYISQLPLIKKLPEGNSGAIEYLDNVQIKEMLSAADDKQRFYITVMLCSGMRPYEFLSLRWEDVNFKEGYIDVPDYSATKLGRKIPMTDALRSILSGPRPLTERVCPYQTSSGANSMMQKLSKKVGFKINLYILRKTFATAMINNDVHLFDLSKLLGHKSPNTTAKWYAEVEYKRLLEAMKKNPFGNSGTNSGTNKQLIEVNTSKINEM